jgi:hypothetical protein
MPEPTVPTHQHERVLAAAGHLYEARTGLLWDALPAGPERWGLLLDAERLVKAIDAADDRIRLTLPEFNAIKAEALSDLNSDLHLKFGRDGQLDAIRATGVTDYIDEQRQRLIDRHSDPKNSDEAMESLIRERVAAELAEVADTLDHASLDVITAGLDIDRETGVPPRFKRRMIAGCADWLRTRGTDILEERVRLYGRVRR